MSRHHTETVSTEPVMTQGNSTPCGIHTMLELYGCPSSLLDDPEFIEQALRDAVIESRCELVQFNIHRFQPQGVTAMALLAESHLTIHTWPEHGYAAADLFTCGQRSQPEAACDLLAKRFAATGQKRNTLRRGGPNICS